MKQPRLPFDEYAVDALRANYASQPPPPRPAFHPRLTARIRRGLAAIRARVENAPTYGLSDIRRECRARVVALGGKPNDFDDALRWIMEICAWNEEPAPLDNLEKPVPKSKRSSSPRASRRKHGRESSTSPSNPSIAGEPASPSPTGSPMQSSTPPAQCPETNSPSPPVDGVSNSISAAPSPPCQEFVSTC